MVEDDLRGIVKALRADRMERKLSQMTVANLMNSDQSNVSEIERFAFMPRIGSVQRLANALGYELQVTLVKVATDD